MSLAPLIPRSTIISTIELRKSMYGSLEFFTTANPAFFSVEELRAANGHGLLLPRSPLLGGRRVDLKLLLLLFFFFVVVVVALFLVPLLLQ